MRKQIAALWSLISNRRNTPYRISGFGYPSYTYHEGDHKVVIGIEATIGNPKGDCIIYASDIDWWEAPHDNEPISEEKRQQILQRLCEYLDRRHSTYWMK